MVEPEFDYSIDIDLEGSDFDEPQPAERVVWVPNAANEATTSSLPRISRPYKGVRVITQFFGGRHYGLDIGVPTGTPVYAPHAGQVVVARADSTGYGFVICIKDDSRGIYSVLGHLNGMAGIIVRVGQWVKEREHVGYSDNTGNSTGPHLHWELRVKPYGYPGSCVDPLNYSSVWDDAPTPTPPPPDDDGDMWRVIKRKGDRRVAVYAAPNKSSKVVDHYEYGEVVDARRVAGKANWLKTDEGYCMIVNGNNVLMELA